MNVLSGKKGAIVIVLTAVTLLINLVTGQDFSSWVRGAINSVGWGEELNGPGVAMAANLVTTGFAAWAAFRTMLKFYRERQAGASLMEVGTIVGAVKKAFVEGLVAPSPITPPAVAEPPSKRAIEKIKAVNKDVGTRKEPEALDAVVRKHQ